MTGTTTTKTTTTTTATTATNVVIVELECDYFVVGAGATTLAFIDTLVTELPDAKIVLIDKKAAPGGHWVDAYGYVKLHQPSIVYGIASRQLEGNWLRCLLTKFMMPWNHRANKTELLSYFADFVNDNKEQIDFYPNSVYNNNKSDVDGETKKKKNEDNNNDNDDDGDDDNYYSFSSIDGSVSYKVKVNVKFIDGISNENIVPHNSPLQFPVDEKVRVMTPNQVYDSYALHKNEMRSNKYVVLGAGKTAMDAVVYLQRTMNIDPDNIAWVISQDVWMSLSGGGGSPKQHGLLLLKYNNDVQRAALEGERTGQMVRLDKTILPTVFKFPVVPQDELTLMQNVKTIVRRGRATAIRCRQDDDRVVVEFGNNNSSSNGSGSEDRSHSHSPWEVPFAVPSNKCVFVHATSPGPFATYQSDDPNEWIGSSIFNNNNKMTLNLLFEPPISITMSCLAKVEANRRKGTLDLQFMKRLMVARNQTQQKQQHKHKHKEQHKEDNNNNNNNNSNNNKADDDDYDDYTENEMLDALIQPWDLIAARPLLNLAVLLSIYDKDPLLSMKWMKQNRLAFLGSIPGFKCMVYKEIQNFIVKSNGKEGGTTTTDNDDDDDGGGGEKVGLTEPDMRMLELLEEKLRPLKGM